MNLTLLALAVVCVFLAKTFGYIYLRGGMVSRRIGLTTLAMALFASVSLYFGIRG